MKNDITELVFVLDESGSMAGLESDTIGGFNGMLEKQKKESGRAYVTTVLFASGMKTLHDRERIDRVRPLTGRDYVPGGSTALIDAVGSTIEHISSVHRYIRKEDVPERTVFIITTDGMENASRNYSADAVRRMIEKKKEKGWEFIFLGANIDSVSVAGRFGIDRSRAVDYLSDCEGTRTMYEAVSEAVTTVRRRKTMDSSWRKGVDSDTGSRRH